MKRGIPPGPPEEASPPRRRAGALPWSLPVVGAAVILGCRQVADPDVFWHLATGEHMLAQGRLLRVNLFSWTHPDHPWWGGEWLFQVLLARVYGAGGWAAVSALKALLVLLLGALLYRGLLALRSAPGLAAPLVVLALAAMHTRFAERPQLISYLLFATVVFLVARAPSRPSRLVWCLPPLFALWSNIHPELSVGLLYLAAAVAGALLLPSPAGTGASHGRGLILPALASVPATLLNPGGHKVLTLPLLTVLQEQAIQVVEHQPAALRDAPLFWACLAATVALLLPRRREDARGDLLPVLAMGLVAARYQRAIPFFLIAALPPVGARLGTILAAGPRARRVGRGVLLLAATAALVRAAAFEFPGFYRPGRGVNEQAFPVAAANFLLAEPWAGRLYNDYWEGGYLIHRLYPRMRVFQDGRVSAYPLEFVGRLYAAKGAVDMARLFEQYDVGLVLRHHRYIREATPRPDWALVFWDGDWQLWARRGPPNRELIERHEYRFLFPGRPVSLDQPPAELEGLASELARNQAERLVPLAGLALDRGLILARLGRPGEAERSFRDAVRIAPDFAPGWTSLGLLLADTGRAAEARPALTRAIELDPSQTAARARLEALRRG